MAAEKTGEWVLQQMEAMRTVKREMAKSHYFDDNDIESLSCAQKQLAEDYKAAYDAEKQLRKVGAELKTLNETINERNLSMQRWRTSIDFSTPAIQDTFGTSFVDRQLEMIQERRRLQAEVEYLKAQLQPMQANIHNMHVSTANRLESRDSEPRDSEPRGSPRSRGRQTPRLTPSRRSRTASRGRPIPRPPRSRSRSRPTTPTAPGSTRWVFPSCWEASSVAW